MFDVGLPELIVIMVIALVVFGPQKLPEIAKALGKAIRELKRAGEELKENLKEETTDSRELKNSPPQNYPPTDSPQKNPDFKEPAVGTPPIPTEAVPADVTAKASQLPETPIPIHEEPTSPLTKDMVEGEKKEKPLPT
jgi:sec-independent protein translocase protein TatA